jgi:Xaa-Pro dipeptidase
MNREALTRVGDELRSLGLDAALLTSPWTITWLTGYAPPIQTGPSPFDGGPALGWYAGEGLTLITSDGEAGPARDAGVEVRAYTGYTIDAPLDVVERQSDALRDLLGDWSSRGARIALETRFLTVPLWGAVQDMLPAASWTPMDLAFEKMRAVKTPDEIARLRAALALCDLAQAEVRARLRPGISEIALWGQIKAGLEIQAGSRLPLLADLVAGVRTGDIGGPPGEYVLKEGDPVMADIVPRLGGYWGDICGGHFVGNPSPEMAKIWSTVRDTLRRGIDAVRPGVVARDLDALMRAAIRDAGYEPSPFRAWFGCELPRGTPHRALQ